MPSPIFMSVVSCLFRQFLTVWTRVTLYKSQAKTETVGVHRLQVIGFLMQFALTGDHRSTLSCSIEVVLWCLYFQ